MNIFDPQLKRFGIFGASESGKSTLAKKISLHFWQTEKRPTVVLDPVSQSSWGAHTKMFTNEDSFWKYIFDKAKNCLIIVDDASVTINRDNSLNGVFTTLRHKGHKLVVIGHSSRNLLPQMRHQIQRIFLFQQNRKAIEAWEDIFPAHNFEAATTLPQYTFLTAANHQPILIRKLTI